MKKPRTYFFIMGTAAELIKMFPVLDGVRRANADWRMWSTGQGSTNFWLQYDDFQLPRDRAFVTDPKAQDLSSSAQAMRWLARNFFMFEFELRQRIQTAIGKVPGESDLCVVHGDTFSTFLGAYLARQFGCPIAHVEAGMRSGSLWSPFPEEINRRMVSKMTNYHFAPDENAAENLRQEEQAGEIIVTGGNSVADALRSTLQLPRAPDLPSGRYVVANLHRFENLNSASHWQELVRVVLKAQVECPVYFVMHPPAEHRLEKDLEAKSKLTKAGVSLWKRQTYTKFVHLLAGADFVLTDGGSNQTECAYLGMPCLILREKTELIEGIGRNCVLSKMNSSIADDFLRDREKYRCKVDYPEKSPSQKIVERLLALSV